MATAGDTLTHLCLVCEVRVIPTYRAFCSRCFVQIPWELRIGVVFAHRDRVLKRETYDQKIAELKQFIDDHKNARAGEQQLP
jgi:hypothetical protein